jgi:WD40 repeat protein
VSRIFLSHAKLVRGVVFNPDGRSVVSVDADGTVRIWPGPSTWPDLVCDKLNINMSQQDWTDWVSTNIGYTPACPNLPEASDDPV